MPFVSFLALGFFLPALVFPSTSGSTQSLSVSTSTSTVTAVVVATPTSTPSTTPPPTPSTTTTNTDLILTTVFAQPSGCSSGLTMLPYWGDELIHNILTPLPSITVTSCYPSQFYSSLLAVPTLWPAFSQLVCPQDWETYNITEDYIICCPEGYGVYGVNYYSSRPGLDAVCTSSISPGSSVNITSYDSTALGGVIPTTIGKNASLVKATAFDGTRASLTGTTSSMATSTTTTSSSAALRFKMGHLQILGLLQLLLLLRLVL